MNLASPFSISLVVITALALLGLPIGLSMIAGSILYLFIVGADMGTVAEQFLNGMYSNYVMLAVPLFILAAELMNNGSLSERLRAGAMPSSADSAAVWPRSISCRASSLPACPVRPLPMPRAPAR